MSNYEKQWSSAYPGLLVLMIDQSGSMSEDYKDGETKAIFATKALNKTIKTIIMNNFSGGQPKDRCKIAVFGYGTEAKLLTSGFLSALSPIREDIVKQKVSDNAGSYIEKNKPISVYIEPCAYGQTNMTAAFKLAKEEVEHFIIEHNNCPAPVIINISDGEPYLDDNFDFDNARQEAESIMSLPCDDGNPLIFNAHIEQGGFSIKLPANRDDLPNKEGAKFLFDISSVIPNAYYKAAEKNGLKVTANARGCMIGVEAEDLVKLIDFGSDKLTDPAKA